jgi:type I restriction enzyme M protein
MQAASTSDSGTVFSQAVAHLGMADAPTPKPVAALMARLLQPWRAATIYAPACGHGELLLATLAETERRYPGTGSVQLRGQEADPGPWAITCMQLLARQIDCSQILCGDVLAAPLHLAQNGMVLQNDLVLADLPEQPIFWQHEFAARESPKRFPALPPKDGRLAQVWHMLASLRAGGRMALLIPPTLLADHSSFSLRHTLLHSNWLDAVITLPNAHMRQRLNPPRLLIISKRRPGNAVAFIHPARQRPSGENGHPYPYDNLAIRVAYRHFCRGQPHADLQTIGRGVLLQQKANLDSTTLLPGIAAAGSATASGAEVPVSTLAAAA